MRIQMHKILMKLNIHIILTKQFVVKFTINIIKSPNRNTGWLSEVYLIISNDIFVDFLIANNF